MCGLLDEPKRVYSVNLWGSVPYENDDCHTGEDYETLEEALYAYTFVWLFFGAFYTRETAYIEIAGPDIQTHRQNPLYVPYKDNDKEWQREIAMQNGMAFGCEGYNDAMGY